MLTDAGLRLCLSSSPRRRSGSASSSGSPSGQRSTRSSPSPQREQQKRSTDSTLRGWLVAIAVVAFVASAALLALLDALGIARQEFRAETLVGLFIAAALALLGVRGVDEWVKRNRND